MFSKHSPAIVAPLAQALTSNQRLLALRSENLPLAVACESYANFAAPNLVAYSHRLATVSQEEFIEANEVPTPVQEESFDRQIELMAQGLQSITYASRNVIIPSINALVDAYKSRQAGGVAPKINMIVQGYASVHNETGLVNHIQTRYASIGIKSEYRTYILGPKDAGAIIELAAVNNPHIPQEVATEWLLKVGAERVTAVWAELFNRARAFVHGGLSFTSPGRAPQNVDELLLAYCLCGHFIENPLDDVGESSSLEEWSKSMQILHEYFGTQLLAAYERRVDDVKRNILVYRSYGESPLRNLEVTVEVNGDVYPKWKDAGGRPEAILGAAVYQSHLRNGDAIAQLQEQLVSKWNQLYPLMRTAAQDRSDARRRQDYTTAMLDGSVEFPEGLPVLQGDQLARQVQLLMRTFSDTDLDNPFTVYSKLVCKIYYDNPIYCEFLDGFELYRKLHPDAGPRELALYSLIEVAASWLAQQTAVIDFSPKVDPNAVLEEEVSVEDEAADPAKVDDTVVKAAEEKLGMKLPEAYLTYVKAKGALTAGSRTLTGLGVAGYQNVVDATLENRKDLKEHANDMFLVEDRGESGKIWSDADGKLFQQLEDKVTPLDEDFDAYLTEATAAGEEEAPAEGADDGTADDFGGDTSGPNPTIDQAVDENAEEDEAGETPAEPSGTDLPGDEPAADEPAADPEAEEQAPEEEEEPAQA